MTQFEFDNLMNSLRQEQEKTTESLRKEISELEQRRAIYKSAYDNAKAEYKEIGLEISRKSAEIKEINADFHNRKKALILAFPKAQGTRTEGNSRHRSRCFGIRQTIIDTLKDIFKEYQNVNADDINVKFDIAEGDSTTFTVIIRKDGEPA